MRIRNIIYNYLLIRSTVCSLPYAYMIFRNANFLYFFVPSKSTSYATKSLYIYSPETDSLVT